MWTSYTMCITHTCMKKSLFIRIGKKRENTRALLLRKLYVDKDTVCSSNIHRKKLDFFFIDISSSRLNLKTVRFVFVLWSSIANMAILESNYFSNGFIISWIANWYNIKLRLLNREYHCLTQLFWMRYTCASASNEFHWTLLITVFSCRINKWNKNIK